jgi:hypothetical protein
VKIPTCGSFGMEEEVGSTWANFGMGIGVESKLWKELSGGVKCRGD